MTIYCACIGTYPLCLEDGAHQILRSLGNTNVVLGRGLVPPGKSLHVLVMHATVQGTCITNLLLAVLVHLLLVLHQPLLGHITLQPTI